MDEIWPKEFRTISKVHAPPRPEGDPGLKKIDPPRHRDLKGGWLYPGEMGFRPLKGFGLVQFPNDFIGWQPGGSAM